MRVSYHGRISPEKIPFVVEERGKENVVPFRLLCRERLVCISVPCVMGNAPIFTRCLREACERVVEIGERENAVPDQRLYLDDSFSASSRQVFFGQSPFGQSPFGQSLLTISSSRSPVRRRWTTTHTPAAFSSAVATWLGFSLFWR